MQFRLQVTWQEELGRSLRQYSLGGFSDGGRGPLQLFLCVLHCDHNPDAKKDKAQQSGVTHWRCALLCAAGSPPLLLPVSYHVAGRSSRARDLQPENLAQSLWLWAEALLPGHPHTPASCLSILFGGSHRGWETKPSHRSATLSSLGPKSESQHFSHSDWLLPFSNSAGNVNACIRRQSRHFQVLGCRFDEATLLCSRPTLALSNRHSCQK